jgi:thiamine-monophosphate kinase
MVRRAGARAGDHVVVTGTIGDAALGLQLRRHRKAASRWKLDTVMRRHLAKRYLVPEPRNTLAEALRRHASAAMDVSDGLAGDLGKLCRASGVGAVIDASRVPLSKAAKTAMAAEPGLVETVLSGGDDFEIVATVRPAKLKAFQSAARIAGVPVTVIGRVVRGSGARFVRDNGRPVTFTRTSFSHF